MSQMMTITMSKSNTPPDKGRELFTAARRWVIKVGSALLTADGRGLDLEMIRTLAAGMAELRRDGREVVRPDGPGAKL